MVVTALRIVLVSVIGAHVVALGLIAYGAFWVAWAFVRCVGP